MSDSIELTTGEVVPIQDTFCECTHAYRIHKDGTSCFARGCDCPCFVADPDAGTVPEEKTFSMELGPWSRVELTEIMAHENGGTPEQIGAVMSLLDSELDHVFDLATGLVVDALSVPLLDFVQQALDEYLQKKFANAEAAELHGRSSREAGC